MKYLLLSILFQVLVLNANFSQSIGLILDDGSIDTLKYTRFHVLYKLEFCQGKCYQFVYIEFPYDPDVKFFPDSLYWRFKGGTPSFSKERNPRVCFYDPIEMPDTIGLYVPSFFYASGTYVMNGEGYTHVTTIDCLPEPDFEAERDTICARESIQFRDLSQSNPEYWEWSFEGGIPDSWLGPDPPDIVYNVAGTFEVGLMASNEAGADTLIKKEYITVLPNPIKTGAETSEYAAKFGDNIALNACATGDQYQWITHQKLSCQDCPNPVLRATLNETITLIVGDPNSPCHDTCFFKIEVESVNERIWFPTAFSPNADGINDLFEGYGINVQLKELRIYNRWGAEMHVSGDQGWDGSFQGRPMEPGIYTYYAVYDKLYSGESDWIAGEVLLMR